MKKWIKNYFLCLKYPFLKARNVWTDKFMGYSHTKLDWLPYGWRKAFGKQLCKELKAALKKDGILKTFRFTQIKEKWGCLCLYNNGVGPESKKIINKYEAISKEYCICCGKPAKYVTSGWISYLCEECFNKEIQYWGKDHTEEEIESYKKDHIVE